MLNLGGDFGRGVVLILVATFCFASMDAMSKVLAETYAITQILWVRALVFTAFAIWVVRRNGVGATLRSARPWLQGLRAVLLVIESGVFVLAFKLLPLADAHAIAAAAPLFVMALSVPLLGEQVGPRRWLAVIAGFIGIMIIVRPGFQEITWPILVPLLGAFLWAFYQILLRLCARTDSSDTTLLWTACGGLAATTLVAPLSWTPPDATASVLLIVLSLLGSFAHLAMIKAFERAEASALQPFLYSLVVWAAVIGYIVFGDIPDRWVMLGATIIVASGLYAWHRERVRARGAP
jgi:drug/metabolite transporter (DMT)-like permease